jgi:hypothetical protein
MTEERTVGGVAVRTGDPAIDYLRHSPTTQDTRLQEGFGALLRQEDKLHPFDPMTIASIRLSAMEVRLA